jgi:phosphopantothenoylcysteine decarboxylase/phosphopantothenate--cysteine ligase
VRTPDVIGTLSARKGDRLFVGFAAETDDVVASARGKLKAKKLDVILANDVSRSDAGFAVETNAGVLIDRTGREEEVALTTKREMADRIWDRALELRAPAADTVDREEAERPSLAPRAKDAKGQKAVRKKARGSRHS